MTEYRMSELEGHQRSWSPTPLVLQIGKIYPGRLSDLPRVTQQLSDRAYGYPTHIYVCTCLSSSVIPDSNKAPSLGPREINGAKSLMLTLLWQCHRLYVNGLPDSRLHSTSCSFILKEQKNS